MMTSPRWATIRIEGLSVCAVMMSMELESQTSSDETTLGCLSTIQHSYSCTVQLFVMGGKVATICSIDNLCRYVVLYCVLTMAPI